MTGCRSPRTIRCARSPITAATRWPRTRYTWTPIIATGSRVTILKPSTTFGPQWNLLRQVAWEAAWVDRVRKGKPILVCGDGFAIHQFLYADDAALGFAGVLGKTQCLGQTYNLVRRGFTSWADYHRTAMQVIGREVELVGVPLDTLVAADVPNVGICQEIFAHNTYYSCEKIMRDVPSSARRFPWLTP